MKTEINSRFIWRDLHDADIFHITYSFDRGDREMFRTALSIHIDDIEGVFGDELYEKCVKLNQAESYDLFIDVLGY